MVQPHNAMCFMRQVFASLTLLVGFGPGCCRTLHQSCRWVLVIRGQLHGTREICGIWNVVVEVCRHSGVGRKTRTSSTKTSAFRIVFKAHHHIHAYTHELSRRWQHCTTRRTLHLDIHPLLQACFMKQVTARCHHVITISYCHLSHTNHTVNCSRGHRGGCGGWQWLRWDILDRAVDGDARRRCPHWLASSGTR